MPHDHYIELFAKRIEKEIGVLYNSESYFQLKSRLEKIMGQKSITNLAELYSKACSDKDLLNEILTISTNNETSFFRDSVQFSSNLDYILPRLWETTGRVGGITRIWSLPCSRGQEAASIAMLIEEYKENRAFGEYEIILSDVNEEVLNYAKKGQYSQFELSRGVSDARRNRFFRKMEKPGIQETQWELIPDITKRMRYSTKNVFDSFFGMPAFDVILCRNLLIYFSVQNRKLILDKIRNQLTPNGYLILGATESLTGITDDFEFITQDRTSLYRAKRNTAMAAS